MLTEVFQILSLDGHRTLLIPSITGGQLIRCYRICMSPKGCHMGFSVLDHVPSQAEEVYLPTDEVQAMLSNCDLLRLAVEGM